MSENRSRDPVVRDRMLRGVLFLALTAACFTASLVLPARDVWVAFLDRASLVFAICFFVCALIELCRATVRFGRRRLDEAPLAGQLTGDYRLQTVLGAYFSLFVNLGYAAFKFIVCAETGSLWFGILGGYYALLGISRYLAVDSRRRAMAEPTVTARRIALYRTLRQSGMLIMLLTGVLGIAVLALTQSDRSFSFVPRFLYAFYGVAGYTAYKVIVAVVHVFRSHRLQDPALSAVREIGYADALVSLYALQTSLLLVLGGNASIRRKWNFLTGTLVFGLLLVLGLMMVLRAGYGIRRERRLLKETSGLDGIGAKDHKGR